MNILNEDELRNNINRLIDKYGSQKAAADKLGISTQYLNDYLNNRRAAGAKILSAMKLRRVDVSSILLLVKY